MSKLLFDFLPIILFFGTFKVAEGRKEQAAAFATEHLGALVASGSVSPAIAPVLLATVVVVLATLAQVGWLLARRRKIDMTLWVSLVLVVVMGGATVWFQSETFIKWKPTLLYWFMAGAFALAPLLFGRNLLKMLMGQQMQLPAPVWQRLNLAWVAFFAVMGVLNLYFAFSFSTEVWVDFKLFGGIGLMVLFTLAQGLYLSRHLNDDPAPAADPRDSRR